MNSFSHIFDETNVQLLQEVEELKAFKKEQNQRMGYMEQKLVFLGISYL